MGVMTINRKRSEECMTVNHTNSDYPRKRFKYFTRPAPSSTAASVVARLSRYPELKAPIVREVHAPCRPRKFELARAKVRVSADDAMGNVLVAKFENAKRSALSKIRFVEENEKEKEVIVVDAEESEERRFGSCEDSCVEELRGHGDKIGVERQHQATTSFDSGLTDGDGLKVVSGGNVWGSETRGLSSIHVYRKLLEGVGKRNDSIQRLDFEIELNEKRRETFSLLRQKKELIEEKKVPREPFVALTSEEEDEVERAFSADWGSKLVTHNNSAITITGEKFQCLRPSGWLNDEVINLYLELLKEREQREPHKFLKCHFFSTFFYKKLISGTSRYDFKSVRRWTRKLGYSLLECDKIFVPIHQEIHWCLAVINKKDRKFQYLDSMKGEDRSVLDKLAKYFVDEVNDKTGEVIDVNTWEKEFVKDLPVQRNGYDCGVFMIKYADFYSRGLELCFNQENMSYFRRRTAKEILRLRAE